MTLIVKPGFNGMTDTDAIAYVNAVEAADGQLLEFGVGKAINDFVVGCKLDNTWSAIKASCILAGARTLSGALVPLTGTAPTPVAFVSGDYNRKTGLVGDGSTKRLNSNRNNNADPQNSKHLSVYASTLPTSGSLQYPRIITSGDSAGNDSLIHRSENNGNLFTNVNASGVDNVTAASGFLGITRSISSAYSFRGANSNTTFTRASSTPRNQNIGLFASVDGAQYANARLAFYSIGESLDLALLDARVTALITAFGVAIP